MNTEKMAALREERRDKRDQKQMKLFMGMMLSLNAKEKQANISQLLDSSDSEHSDIDSDDSLPTKRLKEAAGKKHSRNAKD